MKEYRIFKGTIRAAKDSKRIEGYAAVFNTVTDLGSFREKIAPGAFSKAIADKQDVRALFNHNPDNVLGRTKSGTLTLEEDNTGLKFTVDPMPDTTIGQDVHQMILRGDVDQCSFGFVVNRESVEYDADGVATRTVQECDLFDVSPVTYPAYPTTSVQARSIEETAKHLKRAGSDDAEVDPDDGDFSCRCNCRACYSAECDECSMHTHECGDPDRCQNPEQMEQSGLTPEQIDERSKRAAKSGAKTKRVDGVDLPSHCFAYVGDPEKTDTWKLPIDFPGDEAKTKSHIRNALARIGQTKGIPAGEKPKVEAKIHAAAKAHGIHVSDERAANDDAREKARRLTYLAKLSA
jgi:uncharacterized protein